MDRFAQPDFIYHIGFPKTGSSTLQRVFREHPEIHYLGEGNSTTDDERIVQFLRFQDDISLATNVSDPALAVIDGLTCYETSIAPDLPCLNSFDEKITPAPPARMISVPSSATLQPEVHAFWGPSA